MKLNENTDESAIVIWVTALEGASFETYRNDPSVGAEIRLPLAPEALDDQLTREAGREGAETESLRLRAWKYLGRFAPFEWLPLGEDYTIEEANLLAAVVMHNPEIDCDVLFQYCDLREIYDPIEVFNVALQYDAIPYRKWSSPFDLREIGMDNLSLHEKCDLQLGWELAGKDDSRDRAGMSVEELIHFGETEAEERDLEVWLHGYMDPYEGEIDTARYSKEQIIETCERLGSDIDSIEELLRNPEVTEITVNAPDDIRVERQGRIEPANVQFLDERHVQRTIERIVDPDGRECDRRGRQYYACSLLRKGTPFDGCRVSAIRDDTDKHWKLNIRKRGKDNNIDTLFQDIDYDTWAKNLGNYYLSDYFARVGFSDAQIKSLRHNLSNTSIAETTRSTSRKK